ncbi:MAG: helix-turn-helix domain-containing protein [Cyclobacteriaceae bacterium]
MQFDLTPIQLVTICAVANGLVFGGLLLTKKENRHANRFLALMIVSMCLTFTPYMLDNSVWNNYRWLAWLPFSLSYWIGPAYYFYVQALTKPQTPFRTKDFWHFSPIVLNYLHSIYHLIFGEVHPYYWFHASAELLESAAIISILIYLYLGHKMIMQYQRLLSDRVSNMDTIDLRWINQVIRITVVSFAIILAFMVVSSAILGEHRLDDWLAFKSTVLLLYAVLLYWLSISGYRQAETLTIPPLPESRDGSNEVSFVLSTLNDRMEAERLYRNAELSLADLSRAVDISDRVISDTINQELGKNFYQYVNEYRVKEVKQKLVSSDHSHLKIISLALDAGFNSKASFNRVFKLYTGVTPQQYRSQNT